MSDLPDKQQLPDIDAEDAWVSVIHKMDEAYADLVHYQVEVEEKNVELEEAKSFSDSIQSSMSDVLIVCNPQGVIQGCNRALEDLTGRSEAEVIGLSFPQLVDSKYHTKITQFTSQMHVQAVRDCEIELLGKEGAVPLSMNCSPRVNHRGRLVGMVMVGRPLGELQKAYKELNQAHAELQLAQERLVQSEKMASLGRLVAGVAHELNNPISFVYGNMHALQRYTDRLCTYFDAIGKGYSREQLREMRHEMRLDKAIKDLNSLVDGTMEGADRVKDIVNDLRQFSSTQVSEKKTFDLNHVITTALHWIIKESKAPVEVITDLPETLEAFGHSGQIHQVVVNLIQNAIDAMMESKLKRLSLSVKEQNSKIILKVHDSGPGIKDEDFLRLFEPFYTTKPVGMGTGLGLSISYSIVSEHGGELKITNHPEGGALAILTLPSKEMSDA